MEKIIKKQDWYESVDSDIDYNQINKSNLISRYTNAVNTNLTNAEVKVSEAYKHLENYYKNPDEAVKDESVTTAETNDEHPIDRFNRIKREIDMIEKDLELYKKNKEVLDKKIPMEKALFELKNLKTVAEHLANSENYNTIKEIKEKNIRLDKEGLNLFNKRIYERLNEHLLHKLNIINQLKSKDKLNNINDFQYELYLTPDIQKVKLFTKLTEIKKKMIALEGKIGNWDIKTKRKSISEVVNNTNNNLRFFDKEFQKELEKKLDTLNTRLKDLNESKEDFYKLINQEELNEIYNAIGSAKQMEDILFKSVSKMESLKQSHEDSAFIHLKVKEISEQQEKIENGLDDNLIILNSVNSNIKDNVSMMRKNIEAIKNRIQKLKAK